MAKFIRSLGDEIIAHIDHINFIKNVKVLCAFVTLVTKQKQINISLSCGYTCFQYDFFFRDVDRCYFEFLGGEEPEKILSTIWFTDGSWSAKESNGIVPWKHNNAMPPIPHDLLSTANISEEVRNA